MNIQEMHEYWKSRELYGENGIKLYLKGQKKSVYLRNIFKYFDFDLNSKVLEIGCNVGRNLNCLYDAGYKNLYGVDIHQDAIILGYLKFPNIKFTTSSLEDYFKKSRKFDIIFSMAVLEHINLESKWIFQKILDSTNILVTIEFEGHSDNPRLVGRDYSLIFRTPDVKQIFDQKVSGIKSLDGYIIRIFKKNA